MAWGASKKLGERLIEMKADGELKPGGDRQSKKAKLQDVTMLLDDLELDKRESSESQLRAGLTDNEFQEALDKKKERRPGNKVASYLSWCLMPASLSTSYLPKVPPSWDDFRLCFLPHEVSFYQVIIYV